MIVAAPMNEAELRNLMYTAQLPRTESAFSIRYPRGQGVMPNWRTPMEEIKIGTGRLIKEGEDLALLTIGHVGNYAVQVCEQLAKQNINIAHFDMRFVKPLDEKMLHRIFRKFKKVITVEDGCIQGGFGSAVLEFMADHNYFSEVRRLGIPDQVIEHGEQIELQRECGFDTDGIERAVVEMLETIPKSV
jgi:1-deoxy-D-xylulose-5-phosphate synthase